MGESVTLTVLSHDPAAYASDVVVDMALLPAGTNVGDVAQLKSAEGLTYYFLVTPKPAQSSLQLSVCSSALVGLNVPPRSQVKVRVLGPPTNNRVVEKVLLNHTELHFKGVYLTRMDQYRIGKYLTGRCIHSGQKVSFLGGLVRLHTDTLYRRGHRVFSGYIGPETRIIFRSDSSRMLIFIQMAAEMWDFDETGDIMFYRLVNSFLPEMLHRWRDQGDHHLVSIILFTSVEEEDETATSKDLGKSWANFKRKPITSGKHQGKEQHFYRVVVDQVHISQWSDIMRVLRREFSQFSQDVLVGPDYKLEGTIVNSSKGNVLEAFELATTLLTAKFVDKDLCRATSQVLVATPGPGHFSVSMNDLYQLSKTLLGVEIGVELVCLARPPLHVTPLFQAVDEDKERHWCVPTWINVSFWSSPDRYVKQWIPRCRIYDLQVTELLGHEMRGSTLRSMTAQPQILDHKFMHAYDISIYKSVAAIKEQRRMESPPKSILKPEIVRTAPPVAGPVQLSAPTLSVAKSVSTPRITSFLGGAKSALTGLLRRQASTEFSPSSNHSTIVSKPLKPSPAPLATSQIPQESVDPAPFKTSTQPLTMAVPVPPSPSRGLPRLSPRAHGLQSRMGTPTSRLSPVRSQTMSVAMASRRSSMTSLSPKAPSKLRQRLQEEKQADSPSRLLQPAIETLKPSERAKEERHEPEGMWRELSNPAVIDNPSRLRAYGRWANVYPPGRQRDTVSWRSLKSPASLPLTTESCPSVSEFQDDYTFQFYQVMPEDMDLTALVEEMVGLRLQMGFQLAVGSEIRKIEATLPRGTPEKVSQVVPTDQPSGTRIYLVRIGLIHRLAVEDGHVDVQLYTSVPLADRSSTNSSVESSSHKHRENILVKTRYDSGYHNFDAKRLLGFRQPKMNWSQLDQQIGNLDEIFSAGNGNLETIRFALIPAEDSKFQNNHTMNVTARSSGLTLEELRVEGITRSVNSLLRHRLGSSSGNRQQPQHHTPLNGGAYAHQHHGFPVYFYTGSLLKALDDAADSGDTDGNLKMLQTNRLTKKISITDIAEEMKGPMGLRIRDRRWHLKTHRNVFVGHDLVAWLVNSFSDITSVDEAVDYGRHLMNEGLFRHADNRHNFHDGYFFYTLCSQYADNPKAEKQKTIDSEKGTKDQQKKKPKLVLSEAILIDVDPKKLSPRKETIQVHIDRVHNPKNSFHFQVEWLNATPRLIDDLFSGIARQATGYGLKLVQVPVDQVTRATVHSPFRSVMVVRPEIHLTEGDNDNQVTKEEHWFNHYMLKRSGFILDLPSFGHIQDRHYDIRFSWGDHFTENAQYIHQSGTVLVQVTPDGQFAITPNTTHISRLSFGGGGSEANQVIKDFKALCSDAEQLQTWLDEAKASRGLGWAPNNGLSTSSLGSLSDSRATSSQPSANPSASQSANPSANASRAPSPAPGHSPRFEGSSPAGSQISLSPHDKPKIV